MSGCVTWNVDIRAALAARMALTQASLSVRLSIQRMNDHVMSCQTLELGRRHLQHKVNDSAAMKRLTGVKAK